MPRQTNNGKTTKQAGRSKKTKGLAQARVSCNGSLDISGVGELYQRLSKVLQGGQPVAMDVSEVERADTAALQMLGAFCQDARGKDVTVTWGQPSESFMRCVDLLGLTDVLGLKR